MVKLSHSKPKAGGQAHTRIIGNEQLGLLLSKIQSAVIRSGNELEKVIRDDLPPECLTTLEELSNPTRNPQTLPPIQVVFKPFRPDPDGSNKKIQADFLIVDNTNRLFTLIEVKEGHEFDTKKSSAELETLKLITSWLAQEFPYRANFYICGFNQSDKETIVRGLKNRFTKEQVLTGQEFCEKIGLDYQQIRFKRTIDQAENRKYFLRKLLEISDIRSEILDIINEIENEITE
jgi:hypothetical protein